MANNIATMVIKKVTSTTTGAQVDQSVTADGNTGYTTRYDPRIGSLVVSGTYNTDRATTSSPSFIVVSIGPEANSYALSVAAPASRTSSGTNVPYSVTIPASALPPAAKLYITVRHVSKPASSAGWGYWNLLHATRAESIRTNRRPDQPVISAPSSGISMVVDIGDYEDMVWDFTDDDQVGAANTPLLQDYGGYQVQYRTAPTEQNPSPAWTTPTLHLFTNQQESDPGQPRLPNVSTALLPRRGWTMRVDQTFDENDYTVLKNTIRIMADATGNAAVSNANIKELWLGPGTWEVRVRVFDRASADGPRNGTYVPSIYLSDPENAPTSSVSPWSTPITLYIIGNSMPPILGMPVDDEAIYGDVLFDWQFQSPVATRTQRDWAIFVREVGSTTWLVAGSNAVAGDQSQQFLFVNGSLGVTLVPGKQYEWTARTRDSAFYMSELAESQTFWFASTPETGPELPLPALAVPDPGLGCGHNRVFVYRRGGKIPMGEITEIAQVQWTRVRDDISACDVEIADWSVDCGELLKSLRSWQHELVVFRDNGNGMKRVWEGPIVRISYESESVSIEAKDVMAYVYRRILRQGYNDSYRVRGRTYFEGGAINNPGVTVSKPTAVTNRARKIIQNALAYDDPNVLSYLWVLTRSDDAKQSRVVPDWSRTAWQDIDDMAAKSGLDYTTAGRRIMVWDTHNPIGTLPEMRDGDFDKPPIVTEYGMQTANVYGVTNAQGIYGRADRTKKHYGYVEMLISAWGEADEGGGTETLSAEAAEKLKESLTEQAERGIGQRFPTPLVVRVPDNSTLSPDLDIPINALIPGVHIPLLSDNTLRRVRQMQKLDNLTVIETSKGEQVKVTMSPAPTSRDYDPDGDMGGDT